MRTNLIKRYIREAFTQNISLKVVALIITIVIFVIVHGGKETKEKIIIYVDLILPPKNLNKILTSEIPDQIKLIIQGPKSIVSILKKEELPPLKLDLSDGKNRTIYFEDLEYPLPMGIKLLNVVPSRVEVTFEEEIIREVPIEISLEGQTINSLKLKSISTPLSTKIKIRGAKTMVEQLLNVKTEPIALNLFQKPGKYTKYVRLVGLPPYTYFVYNNIVRVDLELEQNNLERKFTHIPIIIKNYKESYEILLDPGEVDLLVSGPESIINSINEDDIEIYIDIERLKLFTNKSISLIISPLIEYKKKTIFQSSDVNIKVIPEKITLKLKKLVKAYK